jgi:hypothetical protein
MAILFRVRLVCGVPLGSNEPRTSVEIGYSGNTIGYRGARRKTSTLWGPFKTCIISYLD